MAIPNVTAFFDPFFWSLSDGLDHRLADVSDLLAKRFEVSDEERLKLLPSGQDFVFGNRVGWARTYLKKAGLIEYTNWGVYKLTTKGQEVAAAVPKQLIDLGFLKSLPDFTQRYSPKAKEKASESKDANEQILMGESTLVEDPKGTIEAAIVLLESRTKADLLAQVKAISHSGFERLVVDVLRGMGYGGSVLDAGQVTGKVGDGGIDGVIREDKLGLDLIYLQAKHWQDNVGIQEVQQFVGALHVKKADRGVFITTSGFTKSALDYLHDVPKRVVAVDGNRLVDLMFEHEIGSNVEKPYVVKSLDPSFFEKFA